MTGSGELGESPKYSVRPTPTTPSARPPRPITTVGLFRPSRSISFCRPPALFDTDFAGGLRCWSLTALFKDVEAFASVTFAWARPLSTTRRLYLLRLLIAEGWPSVAVWARLLRQRAGWRRATVTGWGTGRRASDTFTSLYMTICLRAFMSVAAIARQTSVLLTCRRVKLVGGFAGAVEDAGGGADVHQQGGADVGVPGHAGHVGGVELPGEQGGGAEHVPQAVPGPPAVAVLSRQPATA